MSSADQFDGMAQDGRQWAQKLQPYRDPSAGRGLFELAVTAIPFILIWTAMWAALTLGHVWLYVLLILPAAGFLLRLFMIQHDCGHGSFLPSRRGNDWIGRVIGTLTLTPYDHWRRSHAIHHASSGNLDRRGIGDVGMMTVSEYLALGRFERFRYRLYRHPAVMFGIGPFYLFMLQNRIPLGFMRKGWMPWLSTMATNAGIFTLAGLLIWAIGIGPFLLIHLPITVIAATAGVWLFYVQHQFEETLWAGSEDWNVHDVALHGSSHYDLPLILRWFTANIGVHHVHHLSSRIPYYRLSKVLRDYPELRDVSRLTLLQSLGCVKLVLWDEARQRLISFRELRLRSRRLAPAGA